MGNNTKLKKPLDPNCEHKRVLPPASTEPIMFDYGNINALRREVEEELPVPVPNCVHQICNILAIENWRPFICLLKNTQGLLT
jgi:hypothetical protein